MKLLPLNDYPEHIPAVARWLYEEWGRNIPDGSLIQVVETLKVLPDKLGLPISFIAVQHDSAVGVARLVRYDMDTRFDLSPWLASVFVPAPLRRHGIGTKLSKRVLDEAKTLGFQTVFLFSPDRQSFYEGGMEGSGSHSPQESGSHDYAMRSLS